MSFVDEQLISSRCRSPHRTYNPAKPGKYGEMIRWCSDAKYRYFFRGSPLLRTPKNTEAAATHKEANKVNNLVLYLVQSFFGTGRNITGDRYFSNFDLTVQLLNHGLTYIGTLRSNKREIPPLLHQSFQVQESEFVFGGPDKQITLCAYAAKPKKTVHMISTLHHDKKIPASDNDKRKPAIILDYNQTKAGVDVLDQSINSYRIAFRIRKWYWSIFS